MMQLAENTTTWKKLIANFSHVFFSSHLLDFGPPGLSPPLHARVDVADPACYSESPTTVASSNSGPNHSTARTRKPTEECAWPPQ
jgi:hypothetical protein